jgi:RHS repeat-associated protein
VACQYDANGNLTNDGTRSFEYDAENQLTNVYAAGQWRSSFRYDAFLRLRVKQEYAWQSSAWVLTNEVRYVYDGMEVVQERDGNNTPQVSYTRGNDLSGSLAGAGGIGGLLARTDMGLLAVNDGHASALYHADGNGNITCLIQTNGTVAARYSYDPFGRLLTLNGALADANVYRFSSKEWHANAGLYYYGYRFYSPERQRWLNRDPLSEPGFEMLRAAPADVLGDGPNLYLFVGNSPLDEFDALGLARDCDTEHIECFRACWNRRPPWPAKKGKYGHYAYCESKCQAEYMECLAENAYKKFKPLCDKALKDKKWIIFLPLPLPRPFPLPRPGPVSEPVPVPAPA